MAGKILDVTDANWQADVVANDKPVVIDFWAPWCAPCRALAPIFDSVASSFDGELTFAKVNIDESPAIAEKFGVRGIPHLLVVRGGEEVATLDGRTKTRLASQLEDILA